MDKIAEDLKQLTDTVNDVFWLCSADRRKLLYFSAAFSRIWGRSPDEFYVNPLSFIDTIHPEDQSIVTRDVREQFAGVYRDEYTQEYRIVRPDGGIRWIWTRYVPVRDDQGNVVRIAGVSSDITDRKTLEQQLAESRLELEARVAERTAELEAANRQLKQELARREEAEESLRLHQRAISASITPIVIADQMGLLTYVNPAFLRAWKYRRSEDVLGRSIRAFCEPVDPAGNPKQFEEVWHGLLTFGGWTGELTAVRSDASKFTIAVTGTSIPGADGRPLHMMGWLSDITERKQSERALAESESLFRTLADLSRVGIFRADSQGKCTYVNQSCCAIAGFTAEAALGAGWSQVVHPDDRERVVGNWQRAVGNCQSNEGQYRFVHGDGRVVWVHTLSRPDFDANGAVVGFVGTVADITQHIEQQQEITQLNRQLQITVNQLRTLLDVIPIGIGIADDAECQFIQANRELSRMLGLPGDVNASLKATMAERKPNFKVMDHGRELAVEELPMQQAAATRRDIRNFEMQFVRDDGQTISGLGFASPLFDEHGAVRGAVGAVLDISDRKRAERALAQSESLFRTLADLSQVGIFRADAQGNCTYVNQAWCTITGLSTDAAVGAGWATALHPDDRDRVCADWMQAVQANQRFDSYHRFVRAGNRVVWVHSLSQPEFGPDGVIVGHVGTIADTTRCIEQQDEITRLNRELQITVNELRTLLDVIPIGIAIAADPECRFIRANQELARMLGISGDANASLRAPLEQRPTSYKVFRGGRQLTPEEMPMPRAVANLCDIRDFEIQIVREDGQKIDVVAFAAPLYDDQGAVRGAVGATLEISDRKRVEEALEEMHMALTNAMPCISILSPAGRYERVNDAYSQLLGYQNDELLGECWEKIVAAVDLPIALTAYQQMLSEGKAEFEAQAIRKDGTRCHKHVLMVKRVDSQGAFVGNLCFMRDISDRRHAEQELRNQAAILQQTHDAIIVTDLQGRITNWNRAAQRDTGYSAAEVLGKDIRFLWAAEHLPSDSDANDVLLKTSDPRERELVCNRKNGETYWAHLSLTWLRDEVGEPIGCIASSLDISQRKATERLLADSENRLQGVINSMIVLVALFDVDGRVIDTNRAPLEVADLQRQDVIDKYLWETYWFAYSQEVQNELKNVFRSAATGEEVRFDVQAQVAGGVLITIDVTFTPLFNIRGEVFQIVGSAIDITQRLQEQEQLRMHREQLAHVLRVASLGEMATGIAHELNQPLMAIAGYVEVLQRWCSVESPQNMERVRETLTKMSEQALRGGEIVRHMRQLVRKSPATPAAVQLNPLILRMVAMLQHEAGLAHVGIDFQKDDDLPPVVIDAVQFEQVVLNLLQNAIDALKTMGEGKRQIVIRSECRGDGSICVSVCDSGPGISNEEAAQIFTAFYSTKADGLGMGLAISRSIIEAHGGTLELDRTARMGATFRITLPVANRDCENANARIQG